MEQKYVLGVLRENRGKEPSDWQERVKNTPGVTVEGGNARRMLIRATDEVIRRLREDLPSVHIEEEVERHVTPPEIKLP